ncbi:MAG: phage scaffolding protein [Lachnospiraceae bacterium]|nr:phage scaffolding protein [Lachnospiraceae bacterium]
MKKEELIAKGLSEEHAQIVVDAWTEAMKGFIPKSRFDEVNTAKADLEKQVADRDKQLKDLKDAAKDNEALQTKITELEDANKQVKKDYEAKIKDMKLTSAIKDQLGDCKYPDLVVDKFDRSKLILAEDGTISGLTEQLKTVRETYKELFTPPVSGKSPANNGKSTPGTGGDRKSELEKIIADPKTKFTDRIAARNELFSLTQAEREE